MVYPRNNRVFLLCCFALVFCPALAQDAGPASSTNSDLADVRALIERGHPADALKQLDALAGKKPEPAGVERLRGMAFYAQNNLPAAEQAFGMAMQQDAKDVEAAQLRGITLFRMGKPGEAIPILEAVQQWTATTKIDPSYVLALCYIDTQRYDDARRALARQYSFAPDSASAYLLAGRIFLRRENLAAAQEFARKASIIDPSLPLVHLLLGEIALSGSRTDEAVAEFEKERERNPLYPGVYDRLGDVYSRIGDYSKAQQSLERAVLLDPYSTGPYILLGKVLLRKQDPVSAASYLERAEKMDPANYMTHSFLSQAYRLMGRMEDATREAAAAQKLQASNLRQPDSAQ